MLQPVEGSTINPPATRSPVMTSSSGRDGGFTLPAHHVQAPLSVPTPVQSWQSGRTVSSSGVPFYSGSARSQQDVEVDLPVIPDPAAIQPSVPTIDTVERESVLSEYSPVSPSQDLSPTYFDYHSGDPVIATSDNFGVHHHGHLHGTSECPSCGPSGCFDAHTIDERLGYFGAMSKARRYAEIDALYVQRTDGSIVLSNAGGLGSFDGDLGWRLTLGERQDAIHGRELSYFGTTDLSKSINRTDPFGRLSALFTPASVIGVGLADPFFNAQIQNETIETSLHSVEINRVWWGWDVVKSIVGIRYIHVDDSYNMFSQRAGVPATYELESLNNLIGVHIGRELFYDVGYRLSFSLAGKAGAYANVNRFEVNATNSGTSFLNNRTDSSSFSTSLELMFTAHYQINRRARFRFGYQGLLLDEIFSVSDNLTGTISPFHGSRKPDKDSMYFHGVNFGLEFYR